MKKLLFKDIISLTEDDMKHAKIALNMKMPGGKGWFLDAWANSDESHRFVSYSYHSHYAGGRNYTHIGQLVFGFVQFPHDNKKWLLVTVGRITSLADHTSCGYEEVEKYQGLLGRLIIKLEKGNTYSRYVFNLSKYINEIEVVEILSKPYQPIAFKGLDNVHLSYPDLQLILSSEKFGDYRNALMSVKGVYCLTDTKTGKLYIGSAYGEHGVAQRWEDYINTKTGGNEGLIELLNQEGEEYFKTNIEFTLIEYYGMNSDKDRIIHRESYWKKAFSTKDHGYNHN